MDKKPRNRRRIETVKDRGDTRKDSSTDTGEISNFGLGDTTLKTQQNLINYKEDKPKQLTKEEINKLEVFERLAIPKKVTNFSARFENQIRTYLDLEGRRRLRERYTVKLNKNPCLVKSEEKPEIIVESDKEEKKPEELKQERIHSPVKSEAKILKSRPSSNRPRRKPIIKTITVKNKNDNRVYKAVTFVDNKPTRTLPLQIKIPITKRKSTKSTEVSFPIKPKASRISIKEKPNQEKPKQEKPKQEKPKQEKPKQEKIKQEKTKKRNINKKRASSPDLVRNYTPPPTEVAKWVPSCITGHTKPYYEAWVDTTLAAISKCTKKETEKLIKNLQRADDELFYENFKDECYTGKIIIRQKNVSKS